MLLFVVMHQTCIYIEFDTSYLVLPHTRSIGAEYFYLSDKITNTSTPPLPNMNVSFLTECQTLKYAIPSATEVEVGTVHNNDNAAIPIRIALDEMGQPQGPTPLKKDNNTAESFFNNKICKKRSKSFDMRFHWMIDRIKQFLGLIGKGA